MDIDYRKITEVHELCEGCKYNDEDCHGDGCQERVEDLINGGIAKLDVKIIVDMVKLIDTIEDECFSYSDDLMEKDETHSYGSGVKCGAQLALKHIRAVLRRIK